MQLLDAKIGLEKKTKQFKLCGFFRTMAVTIFKRYTINTKKLGYIFTLSIVTTIFKANKGVWRMPRRQEAKKDVVSCDKPGGAAHKRYIPGSPNGTTQCTEGALLEREPTPRTETSKYREEKKIIMIPQVVASEKGRAQTCGACSMGVVGLLLETHLKLNHLESWAKACESHVGGNDVGRVVS